MKRKQELERKAQEEAAKTMKQKLDDLTKQVELLKTNQNKSNYLTSLSLLGKRLRDEEEEEET